MSIIDNDCFQFTFDYQLVLYIDTYRIVYFSYMFYNNCLSNAN